MSPTRYRILFLLLGVSLAFIVVFAVVLSPDGGEFRLPGAVEAISPSNDETVQRQISLTVDMVVGYEIKLFVDGVRIPQDEITFIEATGRHIWQPGPAATFSEWSSGLHSVYVAYQRVTGRADTGAVGWVFRTQ